MTKSKAGFGVVVPIITALISAGTTITVTWLTVIQKDWNKIDKLERRLGQLAPSHESNDSWVIKGSVFEPNGGDGQPQSDALVLLLPLSDASLQQRSDDNGEFTFSGIPTGHYVLLVKARDAALARGQIETTEIVNPGFKLGDHFLKYTINLEE